MFGLFTKAKTKVPLSKLPQLHSFVDVTLPGKSPKSVSVESVGPKNIVTAAVGATSGAATFTYSNATGKYRFQTKILGVRGNLTLYAMPLKVDVLQAMSGAQKRSAVRMDTIVPGQWRGAKSGRGTGDFQKGNIRDISRGGCSLIIDQQIARGGEVEIKLSLKTAKEPIVLLGEVMRSEQIQSSGKFNHGLRFHGVQPGDDRAIMEFINKRQSELRSRGLA